jgi:hypothetical protein
MVALQLYRFQDEYQRLPRKQPNETAAESVVESEPKELPTPFGWLRLLPVYPSLKTSPRLG